jgi:hypothetical protein
LTGNNGVGVVFDPTHNQLDTSLKVVRRGKCCVVCRSCFE